MQRTIISVAAGLVVGVLLALQFAPTKETIKYQNKVVTKIDTFVTYKKLVKIRYLTKADTVLIRDTIKIETHPFVATKDTVVEKDTIGVKFWFPENEFEVNLRRHPMSQRLLIKYITTEKRVEDEWWRKPVYLLGGVIVGYGLGKL